jgi:uncharacterized protein
MSQALVDTNVLIALLDETHIHHAPATKWFDHEGRDAWATCPIVQNGCIRIVSQPTYANPTPSSLVAEAVLQITKLEGHRFWPDSVSITDATIFHASRLGSHRRLTDIYLLGLAKSNGGFLTTFDRHIGADAVVDGKHHLRVLD